MFVKLGKLLGIATNFQCHLCLDMHVHKYIGGIHYRKVILREKCQFFRYQRYIAILATPGQNCLVISLEIRKLYNKIIKNHKISHVECKKLSNFDIINFL